MLFIRLCLAPATAQVFWSETFNNQTQAGAEWTYSGTNAGPSRWIWSDDPGTGFQDPELPAFDAPTVNNGYFLFNSHANGLSPHDVRLTGNGHTADCSARKNVHLRFFTQYIYFNTGGTAAQVGVSTNGTDFTYHTLFDSLPPDFYYNNWIELDLDEADNQPQIWLQFRWTGSFEYHWKIDDVQLFTPCGQDPNVLICDDFESYDPDQPLGPQSPHWTTWSGIEGSAEDGTVSTAQSFTPIKALQIRSDTATGGPQDVVLDLGTRIWGHYELRWNMYIPEGKQGYYNIQNKVPVNGGDWVLHVFFGENQTGRVRQTYTGSVIREFSYPAGKWFEVRQEFDLDNNQITLFVDNRFVLKRSYTKKLGGIDFYGNNDLNEYYIDDVGFTRLPKIIFDADTCETAVDISQYFGQTPNVAQTTGLFDNTNATVSASDPEVSCWNEVGNNGTDILNNTLWYTFTGDGGTYDIQTVPCNAGNYIGTAQGHKGDTQMLIFEGSNCADLSPIACNDDLFPLGAPDFRAGLTLETKSGQTYYMMIDGFETQGIVATGEFCIQINQKVSVECAQAHAGTYSLARNGFLCQGESLSDILTVTPGTFVLPNAGPQYGLAWCFSPNPIPPGTWPGTIPGISSTSFDHAVTTPALINNGANLAYGEYYLTPVVLGGGVLINPGSLPYVFNVNPASGCFFTGESSKLTLLPALAGLSANPVILPETVPPGSNGAISLNVSGGSGAFLNTPSLYHYQWSNGKDTRDIAGLSAGEYTVTISDATGCTPPVVQTFTVSGDLVSTDAYRMIRQCTLSPNPTQQAARLHLTLAEPTAVRLELLNPLGQILETEEIGATASLDRWFDLGRYPAGIYLLRVQAGNDRLQRRLLLQR